MRRKAGVGRGKSAGGETCPCGGGAWGERSLLAVRPVHAGEGERGERRLLAVRPVHAGERGVCWREACPCGGGRA